MSHRSKFIIVVATLSFAFTAFVYANRESRVSASSEITVKAGSNAPGPSQFYAQHNLISDVAGVADHTDSNVVNAWGLDAGPTSPWWFSDNGRGKTTLYNVSSGTIVTTFTVPGAGGAQGVPTGLVFNGGSGFAVNNGAGTSPALFIFSGEDGTIAAFRGNPIVTVVPNANAPAHGAVYKGLAIDSRTAGTQLYATDFHNGKIDVFDSSFHLMTLAAGSFTDPNLPAGFAPFGIQNLDGTLYVTYALQDQDAHDDVAGPGNGFVDAYDLSGNLMRRVASAGELNSPWGLALAPEGFGRFSGDLLVGNFGDGRIHAFDPASFTSTGEFEAVGLLHSTAGKPIKIDGLWALQFGHGTTDGSANGLTTTLFFTAGPDGEDHGLFGTLVLSQPPGRQ
jgi:uncharacterized protein (TIGR03118 family)